MAAADALQPRQFGPGGKYTMRFGTPDFGKNGYQPITEADVPHHAEMLEKYGTKPHYVEAVHTKSGRRVGAMDWFAGEKNPNHNSITSEAGLTVDPTKPTIYKTTVSAPHRRKGVASAMLNYARSIEPDLQHSHALSDDAVAWAKKHP